MSNMLEEQREEQVKVKVRRPWAVSVLGTVTFGIYFLIWYYRVNREMRDFGAVNGDGELASCRPVYSIIAVTIGRLILIPPLVSYVGTVGRVQSVESVATGRSGVGWPLSGGFVGAYVLGVAAYVHGVSPVVALVGLVVLAVSAGYLQARLNRVWALSGVTTSQSGEAGAAIGA